METITRREYSEAIERAILAAPGLPEDAIIALREAAKTDTKVVVGDFINRSEGCGCPMTNAGLWSEDATWLCDAASKPYWDFVEAFDWVFEGKYLVLTITD